MSANDLMRIFYPPWTPPPEVGVRKNRIMKDNLKGKNEPVQARTRIMAALDEFEWKSIDDLSKETGLLVSTVAITTDRMYRAHKIARKHEQRPHGKTNLFRKK